MLDATLGNSTAVEKSDPTYINNCVPSTVITTPKDTVKPVVIVPVKVDTPKVIIPTTPITTPKTDTHPPRRGPRRGVPRPPRRHAAQARDRDRRAATADQRDRARHPPHQR